MRDQDKLAAYIKKEVDSIQYEGEDQMWSAFQKENASALNRWNPFSSIFLLLMATLLIGIAGLVYFQSDATTEANASTETNTISTPIQTKANAQNIEASSDESLLSIVPENKELRRNTEGSTDKSLLTNLNKSEEKNASTLALNEKTNAENEIEAFKTTALKTSIQKVEEKSFFANAEKEIKSQENTPLTSTTDFENTRPNNNLISSLSKAKTPKKSNQLIFDHKSKTKDDLVLNLKLPVLASLISSYTETEDLDLKDKLITPLASPLTSHQRSFYLRASYVASTNEIRKASLDLGKIKKLNQNTGFKYGLGFSVEDGLSVSQDSLIYLNGIFITEITKRNYLDLLVNSYLNVEYFVQKNRLRTSIGGQFAYSVLNRVYASDEIRETTSSGIQGTSSEGFQINYWDNGTNRLGLYGTYSLNYVMDKYEFSFVLSKRFNPVIKDNNAQKNKSNTPFQFGASISRYF